MIHYLKTGLRFVLFLSALVLAGCGASRESRPSLAATDRESDFQGIRQGSRTSNLGASQCTGPVTDISTEIQFTTLISPYGVYRLTADITFTKRVKMPVSLREFCLDGQDHTLRNVSPVPYVPSEGGYIEQLAALFPQVENATIKNLRIDNIQVNSTAFVAGALIGSANKRVILNRVQVTAATVLGRTNCGGLVGQSQGFPGSSLIVEQSSFNGTVRCTPLFPSETAYAGGVLGKSTGETSFINSYARGPLFAGGAQSYLGGIAGVIDLRQGGVLTITNSYAANSFSSPGFPSGASGLAGILSPDPNAVRITSAYWDSQLSKIPGSKTTSQMKSQSTYLGWDFLNVWAIVNNYPFFLK